MKDSQFIVPPENMVANNNVQPSSVAPAVSSSQPVVQSSPQPSPQPNGPDSNSGISGAVKWLSTHKALTASIGGACVIIVLVATVLITRQPVSMFGFQLNPLVPHAQVPICDPMDIDCPPIGGGGGGEPAPTVDVPSVGLIIGDSNDSTPNLPSGCDAEVNGPAGSVSVSGAADCLKVKINNPKATYSKDFRICFGLDGTGEQCTPWASTGGGSTTQIRSGGSFNSAQVRVENRDLPAGATISNVEVGVQVFYQKDNDACGASSGLNWAKAIEGQNTSNPWSYGDQQDDDPGCALMSLRATSVDQPPVSTITIEGSLPDGIVGQQTYQVLDIGGTAATPCTWSMVSIIPSVNSATVANWFPDTAPVPPGQGSPAGVAITETKGYFRATPIAAGTYQVTAKVMCQNGQVATKTLPWVVSNVTSGANLQIEGVFPDGLVGQDYSTNITTKNAGHGGCSLELTKITPAMPSAAMTRVDRIANATETLGLFIAKPTTAGAYIVTLSAECNPVVGDGPTRVATKDFPWTVKINQIDPPPPAGTISLSGTFPNSPVGQVFNTTISTVGVAKTPCTWTLVSVSPVISGATLVTPTTNDLPNQSSTGFRATPTSAGTYQITIKATCQNNQTASKTFSWVVTGITPPPPPPSQASCTDPANLPFLTAIYRSWSPAKGDHLYTTNASEKPAGYRAEGIAGYVYNKQVAGTVPIYRSNQPQIGAHYYSTTDDATNYGYTNEGILGYTFATNVTGSAAWYRMHKGGATSDYVHTVSEEERTAIKELGYVDEGTVAYLCGTPQPTSLQPIYRMWNGAVKEHFYTTNPAERDTVLAKGFISEGITGYMYGVRKEGSSPVYRSYHKQEKHHYFSLTEADATRWGYTVEGIVGYIWPTTQSNTIPLYRLFHPVTRDNLYTASGAEVVSAVASGYEDQGILGYMFLTAQ